MIFYTLNKNGGFSFTFDSFILGGEESLKHVIMQPLPEQLLRLVDLRFQLTIYKLQLSASHISTHLYGRRHRSS